MEIAIITFYVTLGSIIVLTPTQNKVYLKVESPKAGSLDLSSKPTGVEYGEVLAVGKGVTNVKAGDKVFIKAWAMDIITYNKETYYFCDGDSLGICAVIEE
jgi:co-chaperonin GroES (HSP10)